MKQLFEVTTNDREKILVKADQDELEIMVKENKIYEYKLPKIYTIKHIAE